MVPNPQIIDKKAKWQDVSLPNQGDMETGGGEQSLQVVPPVSPINLIDIVGKDKGIQWKQNSCYIDATLFSMFAFNPAFDYILKIEFESNHPQLEIMKKTQMILRERIVNPLRNGKMVLPQATMQLRKILAKWGSGNSDFLSEPMEPQEFLIRMFQEILNITPFLQLGENGSDYFHNVLMTRRTRDAYTPSVQAIIEESFRTQKIQLEGCPSPALLLPLSLFFTEKSENIRKPFTGILPSLSIDITEFTKSQYKCDLCSDPATSKCIINDTDRYFCNKCFQSTKMDPNSKSPIKCELHLSAVICVLTVKPGLRHFVTFVKCGPARNASWVHFNSSTPEVKHLDMLGNVLVQLEADPTLMGPYLKQGDDFLRMILMDPYMYIYVQN